MTDQRTVQKRTGTFLDKQVDEMESSVEYVMRKVEGSSSVHRLGGNSLRTKTRSHEVGLVPRRAVHAATVGAVLVPSGGVVLRLISWWAVVGCLVVMVVLVMTLLRQGWKAEHGATRVAFSGSPGSGRTIVLRGGGSCGWCRCGRVVGRSPRVVLRVGTIVVGRHGSLGGRLVRWGMEGLLHRQRWQRLVRVVGTTVHRCVDGAKLVAAAGASLVIFPVLGPGVPALEFGSVTVKLVINGV